MLVVTLVLLHAWRMGLPMQAAAVRFIPTFAGPYLAYADVLSMCLIDGAPPVVTLAIRASHFNPSRPNDKQNLSGFIDHTRSGLSDSWWLRTTFASRSNNQWKENAFIFSFPSKACSALRVHMPDVFRVFYHKIIHPDVMAGKAPCVIPMANATFDKEPVSFVSPKFPIMPYGLYRIKMIAGPHGKLDAKLCLLADAHVIPKAT